MDIRSKVSQFLGECFSGGRIVNTGGRSGTLLSHCFLCVEEGSCRRRKWNYIREEGTWEAETERGSRQHLSFLCQLSPRSQSFLPLYSYVRYYSVLLKNLSFSKACRIWIFITFNTDMLINISIREEVYPREDNICQGSKQTKDWHIEGILQDGKKHHLRWD